MLGMSRLHRIGLLLALLLTALAGRANAEICFSNPKAGPFVAPAATLHLTVPYPVPGGYPAGTDIGFVAGSGASNSYTCSMPPGADRVWYGNGIFSSANKYARRIGPGIYEVTANYNTSPWGPKPTIQTLYQNARYVTGTAIISCSGRERRTASFPADAASSAQADIVSVPCENGPSGTVTISLTMTPTTLQSTTRAYQALEPLTDGRTSCGRSYQQGVMYGGYWGVGARNSTSLGNTLFFSNNWTCTWKVTAGPAIAPVAVCDLHWAENGTTALTLDFGTLRAVAPGIVRAPGTPIVDGVTRTGTLVLSCANAQSFSDRPGTGQIRGPQGRGLTTMLGTDNPGVDIKASTGGATVAVNTSTSQGITAVHAPDGTTTLTWPLEFTPVTTGVAPVPGRTTAQATVDLFL